MTHVFSDPFLQIHYPNHALIRKYIFLICDPKKYILEI